jgi:hypothetical protein
LEGLNEVVGNQEKCDNAIMIVAKLIHFRDDMNNKHKNKKKEYNNYLNENVVYE